MEKYNNSAMPENAEKYFHVPPWDSAVLGGVVEVVSANPTVGHTNFFSIFRHS